MNTDETFTLWAHQDKKTGEVTWVASGPEVLKKWASAAAKPSERVVKLECRIVQPKRKPKRGKYPNDNFGLPAGYTPHNPDNLTREKVGKGYRLLADVEIWDRECYEHLSAQGWEHVAWCRGKWAGCDESYTYRVPINTPLDINPKLTSK